MVENLKYIDYFQKMLNFHEEGYIKYSNNLSNISNDHEQEFDQIINNNKIKCHNNNQNIKVIDNPEEFKMLNNVFQKISEILKYHSLQNKIIFEDVWLQYSKDSTFNENQLPFIPHIDYTRKFKIMVYLNNVTKDSGPIHFAKCNINKYEKFRQNLNTDYILNQENVIYDIPQSRYDAITGDKGTIILFDTNCPHFAGKPNNSIRKVYRFNYIYKVSLIKKILNKLFMFK